MRNKIDFGIDLGTTNSAIARMENGVPTIKKSDTLKDTIPSCVHFNKKRDILVGDQAMNIIKKENIHALKTGETSKSNTFVEFKRTMGTTHLYESSNMVKRFSSAELSAEVLKKLKSLIQDENISSIVITIPAKFNTQQREDTMKAAKLAGFKQVQLLQEPVAAATAYGLGSQSKDGFWLVFDFGGGTFDAALVKAEEGILSVKDTDGDNWLGGKNLDYAIVDEIIIPYLNSNFSISNRLDDAETKQILRDAMKTTYAEETKIQLSFNPRHSILANLDEVFEDDENNEVEVDLKITSADLEPVLSPLFQKAIDITKDLLKRNNLKGADLDKLILVGGPTHSPILRQMLKEQITEKIATSVDPMTVVAKGAALYASTIDVEDEIQDEMRDETKLQLDIKYKATSVETSEFINIKVLKDKSVGSFPAEIFAEVVRADEAWSSGKTKIGAKAALVEVHLIEGRPNAFTINIYDGEGNRIDCEPNQITILQSIDGLYNIQVLPHHICIVTHFTDEEKDLIFPVKGLEKNNRYPATGVTNGLKTRKTIRPGIAEDVIRIPIYEGAYYDSKTNPELNNSIYEVIITGESFPALLPEGSDVDITIKVDKSGLMKFSAYFPLIEHTEDAEIQIKQKETMSANELAKKINNAKRTAHEVQATDILARLETLDQQLENEKGSPDGRLKIFADLQKELLKLDPLEKEKGWIQLEQNLKDAFFAFEDMVYKIKASGYTMDLNIEKVDAQMHEFKLKVESIIKEKNKAEAKALTDMLFWTRDALIYESTQGQADIARIQWHDANFDNINEIRWKDKTKARALINMGLQAISNGETLKLRKLLHEIWDLRILRTDDGDTLEGGR